jgi:hypothetical protein
MRKQARPDIHAAERTFVNEDPPLALDNPQRTRRQASSVQMSVARHEPCFETGREGSEIAYGNPQESMVSKDDEKAERDLRARMSV